MKKLSLVLLMAALVLGSVFAAGRQEAAQAASSNWKIAVVTSTVTQGEEPYRAGEMAVEQ